MISIPKKILKKILTELGYSIKKVSSEDESLHINKISHDFLEYCDTYNKCKPFTMTSLERIYALVNSVEYIVNAELPGDIVECGVWKGGSAMLVAYKLLEMKDVSRRIYLYDTFSGMTKPTEDDYLLSDGTPAESQMRKMGKTSFENWCFSPLSEVKKNMFSTGYPRNKLIFVKGKIEESVPQTIPTQISLLRLDTDWYQSTMHELIHLFPLLVEKGVLIIDDYGYWSGQKKAVDEYFATNKINILFNRIDFGGRIGIKL